MLPVCHFPKCSAERKYTFAHTTHTFVHIKPPKKVALLSRTTREQNEMKNWRRTTVKNPAAVLALRIICAYRVLCVVCIRTKTSLCSSSCFVTIFIFGVGVGGFSAARLLLLCKSVTVSLCARSDDSKSDPSANVYIRGAASKCSSIAETFVIRAPRTTPKISLTVLLVCGETTSSSRAKDFAPNYYFFTHTHTNLSVLVLQSEWSIYERVYVCVRLVVLCCLCANPVDRLCPV